MERERSPWSIHRLKRRRHDRHTIPSPELREILLKMNSSDQDKSQSRNWESREHGSSECGYHTSMGKYKTMERVKFQEHQMGISDNNKPN